MHLVELDLLRSLVAFDQAGSLAKAAGRVGRSESALSLQMKRLEEACGREMFIRSGRRLQLTDAGYQVLDHGRRMLAMNEELVSVPTRKPFSGRVRIATSQDFGDEILPRVLKGLARRYPDAAMEVQVEGGILGLGALERGDVDVALTIGLQDHPSARRLQGARLTWISGPDFVLGELVPIPLVVFSSPCRFKQRAIEMLDQAGLPWTVVFQSPSLADLWAAARANMGITVRSTYAIPTGLRPFSPIGTSLPTLGETVVAIHYYEHALSPELLELVRSIERSLLLEPLRDELETYPRHHELGRLS